MRDWFVGVVKGVIASIAPSAKVVDLTHEVPAGDISSGAFALAASYRFFPEGTIHVAVVDPGVGGDRQAIAVRTSGYCFVGPDNGILSLALQKEKNPAIHRLSNRRYFLKPVSQTFHGRDIFAPVAAHLSRGVEIGALGPRLNDYVKLPPLTSDSLDARVVYIDRFGNGITNIPNNVAFDQGQNRREFLWAGRRRIPLRRTFSAAKKGAPVAVPGSTGHIEIALNQGHAAKALRLRVGAKIRWSE